MVAGMLSRYFAMRFLAYSRLAHWRHRARAFVTWSQSALVSLAPWPGSPTVRQPSK